MIYVDAQRTQLQVFYVLRLAIILCLRAALFKAHLQTKSVSCLSYLHTVARHLLPQLVAFCSSSKLGVFACLSHRLSLIGVISYPMESLINLPLLVSMKSLVHLDQFCPHTVLWTARAWGAFHCPILDFLSTHLLERNQDVPGIAPSFLVALKALLNIPWRVTRLVNSIIQTVLSGNLSWEHIYCGQTLGVLCVSVPLLPFRRESVDQEKVLKINTSFCIISGHLFHDLQGYLSV